MIDQQNTSARNVIVPCHQSPDRAGTPPRGQRRLPRKRRALPLGHKLLQPRFHRGVVAVDLDAHTGDTPFQAEQLPRLPHHRVHSGVLEPALQ